MNTDDTNETRRKILAAMVAAPAALLAGCGVEGDVGEEALGVEASGLTISELQTLCNNFYAMSNVVEIRVTMSATEWNTLRGEQPKGGQCLWDRPTSQGDRYDWHLAETVTIVGSQVPSTLRTFSNVGMKKKSHCGSFDTNKPSFKFDFSQFNSAQEAQLEALIGTARLTLNNCKQDESFIRQPLSYHLFKQAGLPFARCNFCKLFVNGELMGVYVNVEPIRDRFLQNNFSTARRGNLYEFELGDDFDRNRFPFIDVESASVFKTPGQQGFMADLGVAADEIGSNSATRIGAVIDLGQYTKFLAMEFLLKHFDSYDGGISGKGGNNTYIYNDAQAIATPVAGANPKQVWFKFIPYGTDQILSPNVNFGIPDITPSKVSRLFTFVHGNATLFAGVRLQIRLFGDTVFSRANIEGSINQFIEQMKSTLQSMGATAFFGGSTQAVLNDIAVVRQQLGLVRSAAYLMGGFPTTSLYIKDATTGDVLRASLSQHLGSSTGTDFETVHRSFIEDANDRWFAQGFPRFVNEGNGGWLHCSGTIRTSANHLMVYTTHTNDSMGSKDFWVGAELGTSMPGNDFCITGRCTLSNNRNQLFLKFGTDDPSPGTGAQRIYQTGPSTATKVIFY